MKIFPEKKIYESDNSKSLSWKDVRPLPESKKITTLIYKILPIEEADAAHKILKEGGHVGKVVLSVSGEEWKCQKRY